MSDNKELLTFGGLLEGFRQMSFCILEVAGVFIAIILFWLKDTATTSIAGIEVEFLPYFAPLSAKRR